MTQCFIREARESDLDDIAEIEKGSFADPWTKETICRFLCVDTEFIVLVVDGDIVGYGIMNFSVQDTAELFSIAVKPCMRGRRFSSLMMEHLISRSRERGAERVILEVRESNLAAVGLYEKYGFKAVGRRKRYYSHPVEDAVLMDLEMR